MILQQPVSFEAAVNFAKLKETVLSSFDKQSVFQTEQMAPQIASEPISIVTLEDQEVNAFSQQNSSVDKKGSVRQIIKEEIQQAMFDAPNLRSVEIPFARLAPFS